MISNPNFFAQNHEKEKITNDTMKSAASRPLSDREYAVLRARGLSYAESAAPMLRAQNRRVPLFTPPRAPEVADGKRLSRQKIAALSASQAKLIRALDESQRQARQQAREVGDLRRENAHLQEKVKIFRAEMQRQGANVRNDVAPTSPVSAAAGAASLVLSR